jgi:glycerophosphoryl diester phosphodiesterase
MPVHLPIRLRFEAAGDAGRPLLGGHRGNPAEHPENTLRSFWSALEIGVDMVECDIHLSADDELVVIHDDTVDRTTDGKGLVREKTLAELRSLDAGGGERIPTLAEVIDLVKGRAGLVIELKQGALPYPGLEQRLIEQLRGSEMLDQAIAISFHHPWIGLIKQMEPQLMAGILEVRPSGDPAELLQRAGAEIYSPHYSGATPELVARVHQAHGVIGVWTVDDLDALATVRRAGVDAVFSNRPGEIAPALRE